MTYVEIEIPRTGFKQETFEVVEQKRAAIAEGDEIDFIVRGVVVREQGELMVREAKLVKVVQLRKGRRK